MQFARKWAFRGAMVATVVLAVATPSFGGSPPNITIHDGTFAQFTFANASNPFVVTDTSGVLTSNTEQVNFNLFDGTSTLPSSTVHALISFSGIAGSEPGGISNIQDINYKFDLDPAYYSNLNASTSNLLTIGTITQPDGKVVSSNVELVKGKTDVSELSGESTAYSSDYFRFGDDNDTQANNWTASFSGVSYKSDGPLGFSASSGSGQFYAGEVTQTNPLPTPELGSIGSLGVLLVPSALLLLRRRTRSNLMTLPAK